MQPLKLFWRIAGLHFRSETGMPEYDPVARKVYVNLQDQNIFAVIDPATDQVGGFENAPGLRAGAGRGR